MAKGSSSGIRQKLRDAGDKIGMALGGCKGIVAILCSEAARRAAEKAEEVADEASQGAQATAKVGSDLAPAMRRWFGNGVENLLKNPNLRPTWATDDQLRAYQKIAEDALTKYTQNPNSPGAQKGLEVQTLRLEAILKELAQRASERGGQ